MPNNGDPVPGELEQGALVETAPTHAEGVAVTNERDVTTSTLEITTQTRFADSAGFTAEAAGELFQSSLVIIKANLDDIEAGLGEQLDPFLDNPEKESTVMRSLLEKAEAAGNHELKVALFNVYRVSVSYGRGAAYGANPKGPSSDVNKFFNDKLEIPETGLIVVDFFFIRNFAQIVERLTALGTRDGTNYLSRLRIRVPNFVLANHLAGLDRTSDNAKAFAAACELIGEDQVIVGEGITHTGDIALGEGEEMAIRFAPRADAIIADFASDTEGLDDQFAASERAFVTRLQKTFTDLTVGGIAMVNVAVAKDDHAPLAIMPDKLSLNPGVRKSQLQALVTEACLSFSGTVSIQPEPGGEFVNPGSSIAPEVTDIENPLEGQNFNATTYFVVRRDS
ncbi:hypothetical protein HOD30_04870 [Candidatus Peregrinibacteria bacterium]|jgi:hypothetical protein|nr:hypothetical protein [Candidatus Peregrinibacteria bacterium]MBT4631731.1 hypothetical protein [Candidatus Peregrinibacteria bacterium]